VQEFAIPMEAFATETRGTEAHQPPSPCSLRVLRVSVVNRPRALPSSVERDPSPG
jgi:hypothetical protein